MNTNQQTTLIVGGTGKTGSRVAKRLEARGLPVRIGSRKGTPSFDWEDPRTFGPALSGVDRVYLTYYPDLAAPGAAERIGELAQTAAKQGVSRLVLLSGRGEPQVIPSENAVREAGVPWTILRAAWFAQNFSEGHFVGPILSGEFAFPGAAAGEPFVDVEDIAELATLALTEDGHAGKIYDVTGPRLLTFPEAIAQIARASGRSIQYVQVTPEEYGAHLRGALPDQHIEFLVELFAGLIDGHNAHVSPDVERVLGRKARDFSDYVKSAAASGVWST